MWCRGVLTVVKYRNSRMSWFAIHLWHSKLSPLAAAQASVLSTQQTLVICSHPPPGLSPHDAAVAATQKSVPAHSKGGVSALVAHSHAPLMATGTNSQVVKVWTEDCDVVGVAALLCCSNCTPLFRGWSLCLISVTHNSLSSLFSKTACLSACLSIQNLHLLTAVVSPFHPGWSNPPPIHVLVPEIRPSHMHDLAPIPAVASCGLWGPDSHCVCH